MCNYIHLHMMVISSSHCEELYEYPENTWMMTPSIRWRSLCDALRQYNSPLEQVAMPSDRKWEIVSALQKSIRRGDGSTARQVLAAAVGLHDDYAYIWKRLCVTACEDIGPADDVLVSFVIACAHVFPPRTIAAENHGVWAFLVDQMCGPAARSRIYCSYGIIDPLIATDQVSEQTEEDELIVATLLRHRKEQRQPASPLRIWQKRNDWRTEGLLRYVGLTLPFDVMRSDEQIPSSKIFLGLPSYCYDMHTRIGLRCCNASCAGTERRKSENFFETDRSRMLTKRSEPPFSLRKEAGSREN